MTTGIRHAAGSLLVVGVSGTELTGLERAWLRLIRPGGVILFRRNIVDAAQTRALIHEATSLSTAHPLCCVDVEGGTVDRLRDALAPLPSAQAVALAARKNQKLAHTHGELIARAVAAFGFNVTLAPVLDLSLQASAAVMGTRTAGSTAADVIAYARGFLAGLAAGGVAGCGKHFPGLGSGALDSHHETPAINRAWRELWQHDLAPYRELRKELPMVMIGHASYPATRGGDVPASASPFWVTTVLRRRIGYCGLIFSDDLEMGGILHYLPMEEAAIAAVRAGLDTVEICHSPELILRAYEALIREAERSGAFRRVLLARAGEARRKRARLPRPLAARALSARHLDALRKRILQFAESVTACSGSKPAQRTAAASPVETA